MISGESTFSTRFQIGFKVSGSQCFKAKIKGEDSATETYGPFLSRFACLAERHPSWEGRESPSPSIIAEGQGRLTLGEFQHFLGQARGSLLELETQLDIAADLGYLNRESFEGLQNESCQVLSLLNRLLESLRTKSTQRW